MMASQTPFPMPGDTAATAAIPHIGKNGQALSEKERMKIASKKGICLNCGVKTHKVSLLSRTPLSNDNVHKGICIRCNPNDVPHGVYMEYEQRNPKPAAVASAHPSANKNRAKSGSRQPGRTTSNQPSSSTSPRPPRNNLELNGARPGARSPATRTTSSSTSSSNHHRTTSGGGPRSAAPPPPFQQQQQQARKPPAPKPPKKKPASSDPWGDDYEAPVVVESEEVRMARAKAWQQVAAVKMEEEEQEERANEALTRFQQQSGQGGNFNNSEQFNNSFASGVHSDFLGGGGGQQPRQNNNYNEMVAPAPPPVQEETEEEIQARMEQEEVDARMNRLQNRLQQKKAAPAPAPRSKPASSDPWGDNYEAPVVAESEEVRMARAKAWQEVAGAKMDQEEQEDRANEALTRFQQQSQGGNPGDAYEDPYSRGGGDDYNNVSMASGLHSDFNGLSMHGNNDPAPPKPTTTSGGGGGGDHWNNSSRSAYSDYQQQGHGGAYSNHRSASPVPPPQPVPVGKNLDIKINIPPDQTFTVTIPNATSETKVQQLKKEIQKRKGIPASQQELCLNFETLLLNDETLANYNLLVPNDKACIDMFHPPEFPCCKVVIDFFGESHVVVVQHPGRDNVNSVLQTVRSSPFFTDQLQYMSPEEVQGINLQLLWKDQKLSKNPNVTLADLEIPHRAVLQLDVSQQQEEDLHSSYHQNAPQSEEDQMAMIARLQQEAYGAYNN